MAENDDKPVTSLKEAWDCFREGFQEEITSKEGAVESLKDAAGYIASGEIAEKISKK